MSIKARRLPEASVLHVAVLYHALMFPFILRPCPASPSAVTASPSRKEPRLVGRNLAAARRRTRSGRLPGSPFQVSYLSSRLALSANFYSYSFFFWILVRSLRCRQMLSRKQPYLTLKYKARLSLLIYVVSGDLGAFLTTKGSNSPN